MLLHNKITNVVGCDEYIVVWYAIAMRVLAIALKGRNALYIFAYNAIYI